MSVFNEHNRLEWLCSDQRYNMIAQAKRRGRFHVLLCMNCKYYNPTTQFYLCCAVHPEGPKIDTFCPDKEEYGQH